MLWVSGSASLGTLKISICEVGHNINIDAFLLFSNRIGALFFDILCKISCSGLGH